MTTEQVPTTTPTEEQIHAAEDLAHGIEKDLGLPEGSIKTDPLAFNAEGKKPEDIIPLEGLPLSQEEIAAMTLTSDSHFTTMSTNLENDAPQYAAPETLTYASNKVTPRDLEAFLAEKIPAAFANSDNAAEALANELLTKFNITKK